MEILIKTTNACNLSCTHCLDSQNKNGHPILYPYSLLETWIPKNANVAFFGGEPLLGSINKMIKLVDKRPDCFWRITTNLAKPLSNKDIELLSKLDIVTTSFDIGVRFNTLKSLLYWFRNVQLLRRTIKGKMRINICMTNTLLSKKNIEQKLAKLVTKLQFDEIFFSKIIDNGEKAFGLQPLKERQDAFMNTFYKLTKSKIVNCCAENIISTQYREEDKRYPDCSTTSLTIHPSGNITTCSQFSEFKDSFANIFEDSYEDVINKRVLCRAHATCLSCEFFDICEKSCWKENWSKGCPYYKQFAHNVRLESKEI